MFQEEQEIQNSSIVPSYNDQFQRQSRTVMPNTVFSTNVLSPNAIYPFTSFSSNQINRNNYSNFNNNVVLATNSIDNNTNNSFDHQPLTTNTPDPSTINYNFDASLQLSRLIERTREKIKQLSESNQRINKRLCAATSNKSAFLLVAPITRHNIQTLTFLNQKYARQRQLLLQLNQNLSELQDLQLMQHDINTRRNLEYTLNEDFFSSAYIRLNNIDDADNDDVSEYYIFNQSAYAEYNYTGVRKEILKNFPIIQFKDMEYETERGKSNDDKMDYYDCCCICVSDYSQNEEIMKLPLCNHHFHKKCVSIWLSKHITCPLCRQRYDGIC